MIDTLENQPKIIDPKTNYKFWTRTSVVDWIKKKILYKNYLIGIDFAFSYPFFDFNSYFPKLYSSPQTVKDLWKLIEKINHNEKNFYGGRVWYEEPYLEYYNSYLKKGFKFKSRRRITEIFAKKICAPSPTFNCIGPGAVGTGSLAGMRVINFLQKQLNIWPFENKK